METMNGAGFINVLIPLLIVVFLIAVALVLLYLHFQKNLVTHKLRLETVKHEHQRELLRANIQAQEEERKRMSRDLHDEMGTVLSIMRMNIMMLERENTLAITGLLPRLLNIRTLSETAIASMREISHQLMPPQLEAFGLIKTLESVIAQINNSGQLCITLSADNGLAIMSWEINLGLYRIIMELINNTIKHSGATQVTITINELESNLKCTYADNGVGLAAGVLGTGLGHKNIAGRIQALNGIFECGTPQAGGYFASIFVPITNCEVPQAQHFKRTT